MPVVGTVEAVVEIPRGLDHFALRVGRTADVRVSLSYPGGQPVADANIVAVPGARTFDPNPEWSVIRLPAPPGIYRLRLHPKKRARRRILPVWNVERTSYGVCFVPEPKADTITETVFLRAEKAPAPDSIFASGGFWQRISFCRVR